MLEPWKRWIQMKPTRWHPRTSLLSPKVLPDCPGFSAKVSRLEKPCPPPNPGDAKSIKPLTQRKRDPSVPIHLRNKATYNMFLQLNPFSWPKSSATNIRNTRHHWSRNKSFCQVSIMLSSTGSHRSSEVSPSFSACWAVRSLGGFGRRMGKPGMCSIYICVHVYKPMKQSTTESL